MSSAENPTIRFELGLYGWSALWIVHGAARIDLNITHVFDDPIESLILFVEDIRSRRFPARVAFHDEPGMHLLEMSIGNSQPPKLSLMRTDKNFISHPDLHRFNRVAQFDVDPAVIATQIEADLFRIEHLMSHKHYQANRSPVPMMRIAKLRRR